MAPDSDSWLSLSELSGVRYKLVGALASSRYSISTRLALWYGASLIVLMGFIFLVLFVAVFIAVHHGVDRRLAQHQARILSSISFDEGIPVWPVTAYQDLQSQSPGTETFVRIFDPQGQLLFKRGIIYLTDGK